MTTNKTLVGIIVIIMYICIMQRRMNLLQWMHARFLVYFYRTVLDCWEISSGIVVSLYRYYFLCVRIGWLVGWFTGSSIFNLRTVY